MKKTISLLMLGLIVVGSTAFAKERALGPGGVGSNSVGATAADGKVCEKILAKRDKSFGKDADLRDLGVGFWAVEACEKYKTPADLHAGIDHAFGPADVRWNHNRPYQMSEDPHMDLYWWGSSEQVAREIASILLVREGCRRGMCLWQMNLEDGPQFYFTGDNPRFLSESMTKDLASIGLSEIKVSDDDVRKMETDVQRGVCDSHHPTTQPCVQQISIGTSLVIVQTFVEGRLRDLYGKK